MKEIITNERFLLFPVCFGVVAAVRSGLEKVFPGHSEMWYKYITRLVTGLALMIFIVSIYGCNGRLK